MKISFRQFHNIVILTGAGVSVASGLKPFRGSGGIWQEHDVEKYSQPSALESHPDQVWRLFGQLRKTAINAKPNAAHLALAKLEKSLSPIQRFTLVTQNIDGLHQAAGSKNVLEIHGNILMTKCANENCSSLPFLDSDNHATQVPYCAVCHSALRPDIVLFGEQLPLEPSWLVKRALRDCDLFLAIGTSGSVEPAASYVRSAEYAGARTININAEPMSPKNPYFHEEIIGLSEQILPEIIEQSLNNL